MALEWTQCCIIMFAEEVNKRLFNGAIKTYTSSPYILVFRLQFAYYLLGLNVSFGAASVYYITDN